MENSYSKEIEIIMNLSEEIEKFKSKSKSSLIRQWFAKHGIESPIESLTTFKHDLHFFGAQKNPKYSGHGLILYPSPEKHSKCYLGEFKNGKRHGAGWRLLNGTVFEGIYKADKKHGEAKMWKIKDNHLDLVFEGRYENGKMQGQCFFKDEKHTFKGNIEKDAYHGFCRIIYPNGDKFEGTMVHGEMSGTGKITYANGDVYEGGMLKNRRIGKGNYFVNYKNENINLSSNLSLSEFSDFEKKHKKF